MNARSNDAARTYTCSWYEEQIEIQRNNAYDTPNPQSWSIMKLGFMDLDQTGTGTVCTLWPEG